LKCFESSADGFLLIGQALESIEDDDADDDEFSETIFCRIEHKNKHFISSTQVIHEEDYCTFDLDSLVNFKKYNNQTLPKMYAKILPAIKSNDNDIDIWKTIPYNSQTSLRRLKILLPNSMTEQKHHLSI